VNEGKFEVISNPFEVTFANQKSEGRDNILIAKKFIFTEENKYVECEGLTFQRKKGTISYFYRIFK
jgi:hypothetical protein